MSLSNNKIRPEKLGKKNVATSLKTSPTHPAPVVPEDSKRPTLADIPVGQKVMIHSLPDHTPFGRRLMEVGMLPGHEVTIMGYAPLRDPIQVRVLDALIAIRKSDALSIHVTFLPDGH